MHFGAPWSRLLTGVSIFATVVCLGAGVLAWISAMKGEADAVAWWVALLPIAMIPGAALFTIRGYTLERDSILVHRLLWATRVSRIGLKSAVHDPSLLSGGIRLFGNGGFYSFSGLFRNKHLGTYRAFITDPARAVILRYADDKVIVMTPSDPERFVSAIMGGR